MHSTLEYVLCGRLTGATMEDANEMIFAHEAGLGELAIRDPLAEVLFNEKKCRLQWLQQQRL